MNSEFGNERFATSPHKSFFTDAGFERYGHIPDYVARRETESLLEEVRVNHFPDQPSRRNAIFLSPTIEGAMYWRDTAPRRTFTIYAVEPIGSMVMCQCNVRWFDYLKQLFEHGEPAHRGVFSATIDDEKTAVAKAYWQKLDSRHFGTQSVEEILFVGTLRVVDSVSVPTDGQSN